MNPEKMIGLLALLGLGLVVCWRLVKWLGGAKPKPDPWDQETEDRIQQADAVPICTRCLEPYESACHYCPNCGLPVDTLAPFSPYLYIFVLGDALLTGTNRAFPVNWLTVTGFLLLSAAQYTLLAPVYWYFLFRNIGRMGGKSD